MQKKRILTVDDEPGFIRLLKLNLERTGKYVVHEEFDPTIAVEAAEEFRPDLILLDMLMPKLHGCHVAAQMRSKPRLQEVPIIFLTATAFTNGVSQTAPIDGCTVLAKPISMKDLLSAIEDTLSSAAVDSDRFEKNGGRAAPVKVTLGFDRPSEHSGSRLRNFWETLIGGTWIKS